MKVLVIGSGGREHAIIKQLLKSPKISKLYAAPGNGGIEKDAECVAIKATDIAAMTAFALEKAIDFAVVAPDDPLVLGMVDALSKEGIGCFGPNKAAARIEGSKVFSKNLMKQYKIPTAAYESFDNVQEAIKYVATAKYPLWIKTDGLALGKGAIQAEDSTSAQEILERLMVKKAFGESGSSVVIEEHMTGTELTLLAFCDGKSLSLMPSSMDYKRAKDGDLGLNTGGMGAISPNPYYTEALAAQCMDEIFIPTIEAMVAEACPFKGCLYFGLMLSPSGPKVVEYNCRFGDPEAQVLLSMLETDLFEIMLAVQAGTLADIDIKWRQGAAACVVMASGGYPEAYKTGLPLSGLDTINEEHVSIFHAGTKWDNGFVTAGGRVLGVTATAENLETALKKAYDVTERISFEAAYYRKDIGRLQVARATGGTAISRISVLIEGVNMDKKYALISLSDKSNAVELAQNLQKAGYEIISIGGTANLLIENDLSITAIEEITGFPECMDGRLKTLHPRIAGGLLAVRDKAEHRKTMEDHKIPAIDILVVNLYPFKETTTKPHSLEEAIENIDIGGPSMIRAAAKNYKYLAVVTEPADYAELSRRALEGSIDNEYRYMLAAKAFRYTAAYDAHISNYLSKESFPETLTLSFRKHSDMRYGENPHQAAAYYAGEGGIEKAEILHGKALSYNNIADAHGAVALAREFTNKAVCVAVKHSTPCGVALGETVLEAYKGAYDCDPVSIFGGILAFNREVDEQTAKMMHEIFLEVIIAPSFSAEAFAILSKKKNIRLLSLPDFYHNKMEFKSAGGGLLIQESDANDINLEERKAVTKAIPPAEAIEDLIFAMKVVKHVKSNAIVVAKNGRLLGQGGGEVSRIWAAQAALTRAGEQAKGAVLASDALFPFEDVVEACAMAGISAIIQPGGSINDQLSIEACDRHGIAMLITGLRHFKH